uniref:Zf-primase domain-containing protein n=1 Tax=Caenorhabditis japonica TaxID=281687 RepID=A0A8R1IAC5_CAEJA
MLNIAINKVKMPKRAVSFADDIETRVFKRDKKEIDEDFDIPMEEDVVRERPEKTDEQEEEKKKFHTLESDEEEEEDHKRLDTRKVEGQEDCGVDFDGSIKITAFNMKEDEEEGHFDETGNFIFDKKVKDVQDAWLDGIDWSLVKKRAGDQWEGDKEEENGEENEAEEEAAQVMTDSRKKEIFEELVVLLQPNQTIAKALADIKKKKKLTAAEERKLRWAAKKAGKAFEQTDGQKESAKLSGLADELISAGFMDAYEWHREKINFLLQRIVRPVVPADEVDMFSDEPATSSAADPILEDPGEEEAVKWEYKSNEEAKVEGIRQQDNQRCSNFVNSSLSEFCVFHVMTAARKLSAKRGVFNALTCGPNVGGLNLPTKTSTPKSSMLLSRPGIAGGGLATPNGSPLLRDTMRPADSNHLVTPTSSLKVTTKEEQKSALNDLISQNVRV